jgi:hypothetical protein
MTSAAKTTAPLVAQRVLANLMRYSEPIFPQRKEAWYQAAGEDQPK